MAVATFQVQYGNLLYISFLQMLHNKSLDEKWRISVHAEGF